MTTAPCSNPLGNSITVPFMEVGSHGKVCSQPQRVGAQVALYESSGGTRGTTLLDTGRPVIIVTHTGNETGAIRRRPWCDRCGSARSRTRLNGRGSGNLPSRRIGLTRNTKSASPDAFRSLLQSRRDVSLKLFTCSPVAANFRDQIVKLLSSVWPPAGSLVDSGRTFQGAVGISRAPYAGVAHPQVRTLTGPRLVADPKIVTVDRHSAPP